MRHRQRPQRFARVQHRHGFVSLECPVHQPSRLVEPVRAVQYHPDDAHSVPLRAEHQAPPRLARIARLDARRTLVGGQQLVLAAQHAAVRPSLPRNRRAARGDNFPEERQRHRLTGNQRQIVRSGVMPVAGQAVRGQKDGVLAAQLRCARRHHPAEFLRRAADVFRNRDGGVVAGRQHQPIEHVAQGQRFSLRKVDARSRHTEGIAAARHRVA